jgi:acyl carrier protein
MVEADWGRVAAGRLGDTLVDPELFERTSTPRDPSEASDSTIRAALDELDSLDPPERGRRQRALLVEHIGAAVRVVLGLAPDRAIEPDRGLFELGMDSLTSVDLATRLQRSLGCRLAATAAFDHPTLDRLAEHLLAQLRPDAPTRVPDPIAELSTDELARLLAAELEQGAGDDHR